MRRNIEKIYNIEPYSFQIGSARAKMFSKKKLRQKFPVYLKIFFTKHFMINLLIFLYEVFYTQYNMYFTLIIK